MKNNPYINNDEKSATLLNQNAGSLPGRVQAVQQLGAKIHRIQQQQVDSVIQKKISPRVEFPKIL